MSVIECHTDELRAALADPYDGADWAWDLAERITLALEGADARGLTRSLAGRLAGCGTVEAGVVLDHLVATREAHTSGNGAWTRYHAGRAR
jgi:hypothetical protein